MSGIGAVRESLRDAELALERAASENTVVAFEHFDLGTLLLSEAAPERLEPKVAELVAVLRENPALYETLVAYFDHDLDVPAAAAGAPPAPELPALPARRGSRRCSAVRSSARPRSRSSTSRCWPIHERGAAASENPRWL